MPHVKLDYSHPETLFEVLKTMGLPKDGEIEVERVKDGVLLKPMSSKEAALKAALVHPFVSAEVQKVGFAQAAREIRKLGIPENSPDVDSDWWIQAIESTAVHQPSEVSLDHE